MSIFYKASKLREREMHTELGEMAAEAIPSMTHQGGSFEGMVLHFYNMSGMAPLSRRLRASAMIVHLPGVGGRPCSRRTPTFQG